MSAGSSSPAAAITLPDMSPTLGALLVGTLLSCVLWGILTTQVYLYFGRFAEDRREMKILVAVVWTLELVHAISISHTTYTYLVLDYTDPLKLQGKMPATLAVSVLVGAIITATVQGYFSFRIWVLAPNAFFKLVSGVLWLSAAAYLFGSLADTILSIEAPNIATFLSKYGKLMLYPTILNLANDLLITAALLTILIWTRQQGIARTALLVDRLILWTIETGMITSGFSCLNLAFYDTEPNNFIWIAMQIIKARLFANTLLATLNSRTAFLAAMGPSTRDTDTMTGPSAAGARSPDHLQFTSNIDIGLSQLSSGWSSKYSSTWG